MPGYEHNQGFPWRRVRPQTQWQHWHKTLIGWSISVWWLSKAGPTVLNLSSWCLVMVERLFLKVPWGFLRFVIVVFSDHTHLLFLGVSSQFVTWYGCIPGCRWFCCCLFIVYCCSHCLWGFPIRGLVLLCIFFVSFLDLQSSRWGRESWLLSLCSIFNVMFLVSFFASSSRFLGLVYSVWLWHFLVILTYFGYLTVDQIMRVYIHIYI